MDSPKIQEEEYRKKQIEHRVHEVNQAIKILKSDKNSHYDFKKLGIIGHSFGGMTALEANYR